LSIKISASQTQKRISRSKDVGYEAAFLRYELAKLRAEVLTKNIIVKKSEITKQDEKCKSS